MTEKTMTAARRHIALHLAHRWFAYLEAPGQNLEAHLAMFHPQVRLSGRRGEHVFANDHQSLTAWFAAVPDAISSHHIVHSVYSDAADAGLLNMVVAYQAPGDASAHGSIISYATRIEFDGRAPRFTALDKTPILPDTRPEYETSWSTNRVLAWVHAELGGITGSDGRLRAALGGDVRRVFARATAPEGSRAYEALLMCTGLERPDSRAVRLDIEDDGCSPLPTVRRIRPLSDAATG